MMARQHDRLWTVVGVSTLILLILIGLSISRTPHSKAVGVQNHDEPRHAEKAESHGIGTASGAEPSTSATDATQYAQSAVTAATSLLAEASKAANVPSTKTGTEISKIVVMGKLSKEDTEWVGQDLSDWQNAIYYVDLPSNATSPSGLRTSMNKAKEALPYLTYIVDNYPNFPDVMAFIHSHKKGLPQAWHTDASNYDSANMLERLKLDTVLDRGYVNLRCKLEVGCPDEVQPFREPADPDKVTEHAYPYIYASFFDVSFRQMREQIPVVATPCCAQFAVSRAQVLQRPKTDYERYKTFLEETHYDDDTSGRVMEYMWHIIFGRDAVHCEDTFDCYCNVYGRCSRRDWIG